MIEVGLELNEINSFENLHTSMSNLVNPFPFKFYEPWKGLNKLQFFLNSYTYR